MEFIDTHAHIYYDVFQDDLTEVLERSAEAGVTKVICIAVDLPSSEASLELAEKHTMVYASAGIHPHEAAKAPNNYLARLEEFSEHHKAVGIGEIGLDYHYNFSEPRIQKRIFRDQLELARSLELPAIIHNRESDDDLLIQLKESGNRYGVVHSFSGSPEMAESVLEMELLISFTGMITFLKDPFEDTVVSVDLERIMIETDAPYLTPKPHRGKRNEPGYVRFIAEKIAELKNETLESVAEITTRNALGFFKKLQN